MAITAGTALQPLAPLAPLSAHTTYHPSFISRAPAPGDPGGGDPNFPGGGGGITTTGPPGCQFTEQGCGGDGGPGGGGGGDTTTPGTGSSSTSGCSLWNPTSWTTSCILRVVLLILGLILIAGGVWMLKPGLIEKPVKAVTKAAAIAA